MWLKKFVKILKRFLENFEEKKQTDVIYPPGVISCGHNVTIGRNVSFGGNVVLGTTAPITIGDHTMIALNVVINTATHDYSNHPMWIERIDRPVEIGKHVWIGTGAMILPGVRIGDYAVVGAGSVVTGHVPESAVVAGNPARIIGYRELHKKTLENEKIPDYPEGSWNISKGFLNDSRICKEK